MKLSEIIEKIGGKLISQETNDSDPTIKGIRPIDQAGPDELTFQTNPRYAEKIPGTKAAAIILAKPTDKTKIPQIIHPNPYGAMAMAAQLFYQVSHTYSGISEQAWIHPEADVAENATIYPFTYIDKGAKIGKSCVIYPHCYIGRDTTIEDGTILYSGVQVMHECQIGRNCIIHANCVIGADGFGFAPDRSGNIKIPQTARVVIGNDVELQAACTIDRGALEDTIVGDGSKLDDQVLIAHGVRLGKNCLIAGQGAIAGSTKVGDRFIMAGCGAVGPSLTISNDVLVGPKAGINAPVESPGEYHGFPLVPARQWRKETVSLKKLPELLKTVRNLENKVKELEDKLGSG